MVDHAQAQACKTLGERARLSLAGHQHRLVDGIRPGKFQLRVGSLETVRSAEQVNPAVFKCLDGSVPGRKTLHGDRYVQGVGQKADVIGSEAFIVLTADGHVERWIVRVGSSHHEFAFLLKPVALLFIQRDFHVIGARTAEQGIAFCS